MNINFKPGLIQFLKYQMIFKKVFLKDSHFNKYVESDETKIITYLFYLATTILFGLFAPFKGISQLTIVLRLTIIFLAILMLFLIIEIIHWFYVKFNLVEEKNDNAEGPN